MERSGMEGYGKEIGVGALILLYGFRLAGFPALQLASFSAPIGQIYTLIYWRWALAHVPWMGFWLTSFIEVSPEFRLTTLANPIYSSALGSARIG